MTTLAVLGTQWGDEGKGKLVDYLADQADSVVRFQGGHNAGHTLKVDGKNIFLHLIPSGALRPQTHCVIGNGVALSPSALLEEIEGLEKHGVDLQNRLWISHACPVLLASHQDLDVAREQKAAGKAIGTTGRGIGPAYEDKVARRGLRWGDLWQDDWQQRVRDLVAYHNFLLSEYYGATPARLEQILADCERARARFDGQVEDVAQRLRDMRAAGQNIMLEGAQGAALDIDHGTYPFVTSSNTVAAAAALGSGLGPHDLDKVVGIAKAYVTRVGAGPMLTELSGEQGEHLRDRGKEVGTTTGRPRRCGWLDVVQLRSMAHLSNVDSMCLTKLDVLDELEEILVCAEYRNNGNRCEPVYTKLAGWNTSIENICTWDELPENARRFVETIEKWIDTPVEIISVGPGREQTIMRAGSPWQIDANRQTHT
jgi:adenylosuccinate synthase